MSKPKTPAAPAPPCPQTIKRLARIESRLVSLMKHVGMTSDGRRPLPEPEKTE